MFVGTNHRLLRGEVLEERRLLAVAPMEYQEIRQIYSDFALPAQMENLNVIDLIALTESSLRSALAQTIETPSDDLIVLRTSADSSDLTMSRSLDISLDSTRSGTLTVIGYGESRLRITCFDSSVITISSGTVFLGGMTLLQIATNDASSQKFADDSSLTSTESLSDSFASSVLPLNSSCSSDSLISPEFFDSSWRSQSETVSSGVSPAKSLMIAPQAQVVTSGVLLRRDFVSRTFSNKSLKNVASAADLPSASLSNDSTALSGAALSGTGMPDKNLTRETSLDVTSLNEAAQNEPMLDGTSFETQIPDVSISCSVEFPWEGTSWIYLTGLTAGEAEAIETTLEDGTIKYELETFYDAEKYYVNDSNLCWAASAANILRYTGWAQECGFETEDELYAYFIEHFTNESGHVYYATEWFLTGDYYPKGIRSWAQITQEGGGFFPYYDLEGLADYQVKNASILDTMAEKLQNQYGISLAIGWFSGENYSVRSGGHAVTVWGYVYDPAYEMTDPDYYVSLVISDSDDGRSTGSGPEAVNRLNIIDVQWDNDQSTYQILGYGGGRGLVENVTWVASYSSVDPVDLAAPVVSQSAVTLNEVTITWEAVPHAISYLVEYSTSPTFSEETTMSLRFDQAGTQTVSNLAYETTWFFRVKAEGNQAKLLDSVWSESVCLETPPEAIPVVVTTSLDVVDAADGLLSLREAVALAGTKFSRQQFYASVITFDSSLKGLTLVLQNASLTIRTSLTIDAASLKDPLTGELGLTIDAENRFRHFLLPNSNATVEISGLTLTHGKSVNGSVVNSLSTLILNDCVLQENVSSEIGAVYNNGNLTVTQCRFLNNTALKGAAIYNNGTLTLRGGTFEGNLCLFGGAMYNASKGTATLTETKFYKNAAAKTVDGKDGYGGAIYNSGTLICSKTLFDQNTSKMGGAIYTLSTLTLEETTFSANLAIQGGALWGMSMSQTTVQKSTFSANQADRGGGIYSSGSLQVLVCSHFQGNFASQYGGAIFINLGKTTIDDSEVLGNQATEKGGAFFNQAELELARTLIQENGSKTGGGIYNSLTLTVADSTFLANEAKNGGALFQTLGAATISKTAFSDNSASYGGGIYLKNGTMSMSDCELFENRAVYQGGALYNNAALFLEQSQIYSNHADRLGGGVYNNAALTQKGTAIERNTTLSGHFTDCYSSKNGTVTVLEETASLDSDLIDVALADFDAANFDGPDFEGGVPELPGGGETA